MAHRALPVVQRRHLLCGLLVAQLVTAGCTRAAPAPSAPAAPFLRASPIIERDAAALEPVEEDNLDAPEFAPAPDPAELAALTREDDADTLGGSTAAMPAPTPPAPVPALVTPSDVIAHANAAALQAPANDGFLNAVMNYTFMPGAIYQVYTAPNNITDLVLEPGEELMGEPAAGDTLRWRLGVGTSAVGGVPQKHVFIKPTREGLATNLTLNTNRRTYFLRLESVEREFMVGVQWTYPTSNADALTARAAVSGPPSAAPAPTAATPVDVAVLNTDYSIEIARGTPRWKPRAVYDDGRKTFIRFDDSLLTGEAPALYVIERDEPQLVNYRVKDTLYVVDRLFELAELRLGQDEQDVVRLRNRAATRPRATRKPSAPTPQKPGAPR